MFDMNSIWSWVLISVACGLFAGLITAAFSRHKKQQGDNANADGEETEDDLDEIEGSHSSNIVFVIVVFAVLAFLIVWLISAISGYNFEL